MHSTVHSTHESSALGKHVGPGCMYRLGTVAEAEPDCVDRAALLRLIASERCIRVGLHSNRFLHCRYRKYHLQCSKSPALLRASSYLHRT